MKTGIENINLVYGNLEMRLPKYIGNNPKHKTLSIFQRLRDGVAIVIAYWERDSEGYELKFIGSRPFDPKIDTRAFWMVASTGQGLLDEHFEQTLLRC